MCRLPRAAWQDARCCVAPPSLLALDGPPSRIEPLDGLPDVLDFPRDIQPILDRHCVACHNASQRDGNVSLTGDLGFQWSHSFFTLFAHRQVGDGRNGLGQLPAAEHRQFGKPAARKAQRKPLRRPMSRRASGGPCGSGSRAVPPTPAATPACGTWPIRRVAGRAAARVFVQGAAVLQQKCAACHAVGDVKNETGRALPFHPNTARNNRGLQRPTGIHERVVLAERPGRPLQRTYPAEFHPTTTSRRSCLGRWPRRRAGGRAAVPCWPAVTTLAIEFCWP